MRQSAPAFASRLVFVPLIGFRAFGTRTLRERVETRAGGTRLIVHAAASAPDGTDVVVEWEVTGDPAVCPPDSKLLVHSNVRPLENGLAAELVAGARRVTASAMFRRAMYVSHGSIGAVDTIAFPPLPSGTDTLELRLRDGEREWRVPIGIAAGDGSATALAAELTRDGVTLRATALARYEGDVIVEMEVESARQIRQVGTPIPTPPRFSSTTHEDQQTRTSEHRRVFGERSRPITLEDDRGRRTEEVRRIFSQGPQQDAPGRPYVFRFTTAFDAPSPDTRIATLVVPFVDLNDREGSVTADLRDAPFDLEVGGNRFRVVSAEPSARDHRLVIVEGRPSPWPPRFIHPVGMRGADGNGSYLNTGLGEQVSFSAAVSDPPIVTFTGAVFRVDGPLRLEIPLS
jgi:hypothetical protein